LIQLILKEGSDLKRSEGNEKNSSDNHGFFNRSHVCKF
jgi:hypothetical protein